MDNIEVKAQYERWVYPEPIQDIEKWRAEGGMQLTDPTYCFPIFFPEREPGALNVLVAGCGTHQSACLAFGNPQSNFTAIDISKTSLEHNKRLKRKHNLQNLDVRELSLFDVAALGQSFDLIISTGVLHHLPDPVDGCRALSAALAPDGVMSLMLYGSRLRAGVYMLQQAFQAAGFDQSQTDVTLLRQCLGAVPPHHTIAAYAKTAIDLQFDGGLVDTFLHPQDTAYSVTEVHQFVADAGLKFHSWHDNGDYAHQNHLSADFPARQRIVDLPPMERAEFVDSFLQLRGTHRFNVCHPAKTGHEIGFDTDEYLAYIPRHRAPIAVLQTADLANGVAAKMRRANHKYDVGQAATVFLEEVNSERTIAEIIKRVGARATTSTPAQVRDAAKSVYKDFWERGHIMFSKSSL